MCGFITIVGKNLRNLNKNYFFYTSKNNTHRGPDQQGHYCDNYIFCSAQTLKITKKSKFSDQPYKSKNGRLIITLNGQIYNYIELIDDLKKDFNFKYENELELIEKLFLKYGKNFVNFLNGMFAISIWDVKKKTLYLVTDHFGIKPIYYTKFQNNWYFSSEIKDLKFMIPYFHFQEDEETVSNFLKFSISNNNESTFYKNIKKFSNAKIGILKNNELIKKSYWDLKIENNQEPDYDKLTELYSNNFKLYSSTSIKKSFALSSGFDSNFILQQSVNDKSYNINKDISVISNLKKYHKNSEYHQNINFFDNYPFKIDLYSSKKILEPNSLEDLEYVTEQPVHSSNIYVSLLLRKYLKSKNYNVLITGHGSDEIFGGYNRAFYDYMFELDNFKNKDYLFNFVKASQNYLGKSKNQIFKNFKLIKKNINYNQNYFENIKFFFNKDYLKKNQSKNKFNFSSADKKNFLKFKLKQQIFNHDLPYSLAIEDKISMANSIETRVPFLNRILVENIFKLDSKYFLESGINKSILRNISKKLNHFQNWSVKKYQLPGDDYLFLKKQINNTTIEKIYDDNNLDKIINKKMITKEMKNLKKNQLSNNFLIFRILSYQRWKNQNV